MARNPRLAAADARRDLDMLALMAAIPNYSFPNNRPAALGKRQCQTASQ